MGQKLNARKDAFLGYVRNSGNLKFYEKWINANPIIVPRKFQKFEYRNESEEQKILRERGVIHNYRTEIEMMKLKIESCIKRAKSFDTEIEAIIRSKCSGQVMENLLKLWQKNVQRNEEISHKRWNNNEKWLQSYENDFLKNYENCNPFFKKGKSVGEKADENRRTYAEVVNARQFRNENVNKNENSEILNVLKELIGKYNNNNNRRTENNNRNQSKFYNMRGQNNRGRNNNRNERRYFNNRSNNSNLDEFEDVVTTESLDFLDVDHNWNHKM